MKFSTDRILTTHVGSLPRAAALFAPLVAENRGGPFDAEALHSAIDEAVADVVKRQIDAGIDIVSDGETGKASYTHYVKHRLAGIGTTKPGEGGPPPHIPRDLREHPDLVEIQSAGRGTARNVLGGLSCVGLVTYADRSGLERDLANLRAATATTKPVDIFMTSASPGTLAHFIRDTYYNDDDRYVGDLAEAMRPEYEAIHRAGFVLQLDCPDLAMSWHITSGTMLESVFLRNVARNVEALNHATRNIPADAMRMHVCWGNYPGPHTCDIAISKILAPVLCAKPQAILFEGANPRHDHEWEEWRVAPIPDDKVLVPGVIDSTTNSVEHPRLVAQRLGRYADIVGRERVIAGTDCGFGTVAGRDVVAPSVVWSKLRSLAEGARMASDELWKRH